MICSNCFNEIDSPGTCPHCGYVQNNDTGKYPLALSAGTILNGRYVVGRIIGQGGFGITYTCQDYQTKEIFAVKEYFPSELSTRLPGHTEVIPTSVGRSDAFDYGQNCFLEEAKTLAKFRSSNNIVRVNSYFEENGTAYLLMEYVKGIGLDSYLKTNGGKISIEETNKLLLPLCNALETVHSNGVVHRDIAPDNILVDQGETAKLIDFGAARYSMGEKSQSLDVILKHGFAPVEQYSRHGKQGPYTDIYAFCATYYYAITGKIPMDSIDRISEDTIIPPSLLNTGVWPELENVLMKGLEVQSGNRYQSAQELLDAFEHAIEIKSQRNGSIQNENLETTEEIGADGTSCVKETSEDAAISSAECDRKGDIQDPSTSKDIKKATISFGKILKGSLIIATILVLIIIAEKVVIPAFNYNEALALMQSGDYEKAIASFEAMGDYKDSKAQIVECTNAQKYEEASELYNDGKYEEAFSIFLSLGGYKDSETQSIKCALASSYEEASDLYKKGEYDEAISIFESLDGYQDSEAQIENCYIGKYGEEKWNQIKTVKNTKVGDIYTFGVYEQDNVSENGKEPIEWIVLDADDLSLLLISKYELACKTYGSTLNDAVTWETSALRTWLNSTFINDAFSNEEIEIIMNTHVSADENPHYFTDPGNDTTDKVFLLSSDEAVKYFSTNEERISTPTAYVASIGGDSYWWLRTPGSAPNTAAVIDVDGSVGFNGGNVMFSNVCVRPVIWINWK